ncbi:hypothetical protein [Tardiphaga sp.]|jgi:hypothetical protein|uniref:hypothetical protein n=1 Tax=Tardiphaga sp. TaxID=1926292 RepID=UPI0037DA563F
MKLVWVAAAGLLIPATSVTASSHDIANLTCSQVGQSEIARQSWSIEGQPFGIPFRDWDALTFDRLRRKVSDCAAQAGQNPRSQLVYLQRLEGLTKLQNAMSASGVESRNIVPAAQLSQGTAVQSRSREQDATPQPAQRGSGAANVPAPTGTEATLLAKVEAYDTQDELRSFCRTIWSSNRDMSVRLAVRSNCERRFQLMKVADQENAERRQDEDSAKQLPGLIREIQELPDSDETREKLRNLATNNNFRLPNLSFRDQNSYFQEIQSRLGKLESARGNAKCDLLLSKKRVPAEIRDAIVQDGLGGVPLATFLCGPILTANNVSVALSSGSNVEIKVDDYTLTFARRRLLKDRNIDVALESPIVGGVSALVLTGAAQRNRQIAIGNPNFFVVNFYSQYTAQVDAYLTQSGR